MRVALIAPGCDSTDVGEAWVAHQWAKALAGSVELTVLTYRKQGRPSAQTQLPGSVEVIEWEEPPGLGRMERLNSLVKPGYVPFYARCRRWLKQNISSEGSFDVIHQVSPVALRYPSPAAGLGVPLVLGPVGGSLETPVGFQEEEKGSDPWFVRLRRLDSIRLQHDPLLIHSYKNTACVFGIGDYVRAMLPEVKRFEVLNDTGVESVPPPVQREDRVGPVRLLFVGRVVRSKGVRDAVRAMAHLRDLDAVLDVVGDGFDLSACRLLCEQLDVTSSVTLHGRVPRESVDDFYRSADIFLFPSYREPGGTAVWEALSFGLPAVVADRGGPASTVDATCGVKVLPTEPQQYARDLADAVRPLISDAAERRRLGAGARRRALDCGTWKYKLSRALSVYSEISARPPD